MVVILSLTGSDSGCRASHTASVMKVVLLWLSRMAYTSFSRWGLDLVETQTSTVVDVVEDSCLLFVRKVAAESDASAAVLVSAAPSTSVA